MNPANERKVFQMIVKLLSGQNGTEWLDPNADPKTATSPKVQRTYEHIHNVHNGSTAPRLESTTSMN